MEIRPECETVIWATSGEIEKVISLGGVPEFPASDQAGNIFVNIDDAAREKYPSGWNAVLPYLRLVAQPN